MNQPRQAHKHFDLAHAVGQVLGIESLGKGLLIRDPVDVVAPGAVLAELGRVEGDGSRILLAFLDGFARCSVDEGDVVDHRDGPGVGVREHDLVGGLVLVLGPGVAEFFERCARVESVLALVPVLGLPAVIFSSF